MDNQLFERCFISTVCEYGVKQYGSIMAYAKKIWPEKDDKNAAQTLYAIQKKSSKTGKPQGLPLHVAVLMVYLLPNAPGFPSFCFEIAEKIRLGWGADHAEEAFSPAAAGREDSQGQAEESTPEGAISVIRSGEGEGAWHDMAPRPGS